MNEIEALALVRVALCLLALPFAVRGRYWLLCGVLTLATVSATVTAAGLPFVVGAVIATPVYALLALHALDISRHRHPNRAPRND